MSITLTKSGATYLISGRRAQVYIFIIDTVRCHPFHLTVEAITLTRSGPTHLISGWIAQVYVFNISRSTLQVYLFKTDKVRGHPFDISEEGTGVCQSQGAPI